ncbi:unnamed protein product [Cuscuta epithymum]|uniref:BHLH domain-containing protein n=1 Tax=Cuscuta epithymum TaxID=186058 RepID=A0AAV0DP07_9ASTE|nr:unnamed protein product [Cuscuta epithymum]
MADDDSVGGAGTFSQLLFDANDVVVSLGMGSDGCLNFTSSSSGHPNSSNMLCFGTEDDLRPIKNLKKKRKNNGEEREDVDNQNRGNYCKKKKPSGSAHATKAKRRESLGDRIAALQKLVSPFGKGDTASVLQESKSYIKFLHDQIQALCSPYLKNQPIPHGGGGGGGGGENRDGMTLRSRGLCLVPVDRTWLVATHSPHNGADIWSPAAVSGSAQTKNPTHRCGFQTGSDRNN